MNRFRLTLRHRLWSAPGMALVLFAAGLVAPAQERREPKAYRLERIPAPDPQASLLDFGHHVRVRLGQEGQPTAVEIPLREELLAGADLASLRLAYYDRATKRYEIVGEVIREKTKAARVTVDHSGEYSLLALPGDPVAKAALRAVCSLDVRTERAPVDRICTQIYCPAFEPLGRMGAFPEPGSVCDRCLGVRGRMVGDIGECRIRPPVQAGSQGEVIAVAGDHIHSLALKSDGTVWAWGANDTGQLGDGTTTLQRNTPVQVRGPGGVRYLTNVVAIAAGIRHSLALKSDGTVWNWGLNTYGGLGDGTTTDSNTPVQVKGLGGVGYLTGVVAIAAGAGHGLALKSDGTVWAWGWNLRGQLGDGTTANRTTPIQVQGSGGVGFLTGIVAVATAGQHSLALKSDGTVWAWGWNWAGQLGDGTTTNRATPVQVSALTGMRAVGAGGDHSLGVKSDGTLWAWGRNDMNQLGDGTTVDRTTPVQVTGPGGVGYLAGIESASGGAFHSLALMSDGTVWAWGRNVEGQLGNGTNTDESTPVQVHGSGRVGYLTKVRFVAAGYQHNLALTSSGLALSWGRNLEGQLGDGTTTNRNTPVEVQ